jgi:hypothetical protein
LAEQRGIGLVQARALQDFCKPGGAGKIQHGLWCGL